MTKIVVRWSGLSLAVGALLLGVSPVFASNGLLTPLANIILLAASILIILALPGMYARQSEAAGWPGLVGYMLLEAGMLSLVVYAAAPMFYPQIKGPPEAGPSIGALFLGTALLLGLALTAVAMLRAGVYPRWSGILLLVAGVGMLFVFSMDEV